MTDWLEEIEADARLHTHVGNTTATGGGSVVIVGKADYDRLIARVRKQRAVVEAARECVYAETHYMLASARMNGIAYMAQCDARAVLRAAVNEYDAALKGEE